MKMRWPPGFVEPAGDWRLQGGKAGLCFALVIGAH